MIKSYTDLSQSRKLAEILPLESADMYWMHGKLNNVKQHPTPNIIGNDHDEPLWDDYDIPCWSLTALLSILPDELEDNHFLTLDKEGKEYCCCYEDGNGNSFKHKFADNPVDACVAMIEKLNELNLL